MSTNLYWRPKPKNTKFSTLCDSLKWIIRKRCEQEGISHYHWFDVDSSWIPYLQGIVDSTEGDTSADASALIDKIDVHDIIQIKITE